MWFLLRSPVLSSLILLCVGLGAGSTAAFFSVLDRSILRPFDYDDADALVLLRGANPDRRIVDYPITFREFAAWRGLAESLESLMAYQHGLATLSATELPERVDVAYVSPAFLNTLYPGAEALGQRLRATVLNPSGSLRGDVVRVGEVVGIVPDVADPMGANRQRGTIYCAFAQHPMPSVRLVVDAPNVGALERLARERIRDLDPALVPDEVRTLTDMLRLRIDRVQFYAAVTTLFGAVALVLAAVGTYGIVRHLTTQRMREFALRAALGATPSHLRQIVLTHGICLISLGIGVWRHRRTRSPSGDRRRRRCRALRHLGWVHRGRRSRHCVRDQLWGRGSRVALTREGPHARDSRRTVRPAGKVLWHFSPRFVT